jgi:hypothetical protein
VRAYNGFLWESIVPRWINNRLLAGTWKSDKKLFEPMFKQFASTLDATAPKRAYDAYQLTMPAIAARLASPT